MPELKFCVKTWMGSILLSGLRDQTLGENGAQELNNGKKIGINWSRIYHVTTLLEDLNEPFRENWSKFLTAGYLVF